MRSPLTMLFAVLAAAALSACGAPKCSASNCSGCCDTQGQCQPGNQSTACGLSGGQCTSCLGGACNAGFCGGANIGGGGGGNNTTGGGNGNTGGGGGTTVSNYRDFCRASLRAQFDFYARCGSYTRAAADEQIALGLSRCEAMPEVFASGRASLNVPGAQACVTAFETLGCTDPYPNAICQEIFTGLVATNGNCFSAYECQNTLWCDTSSTCPGACKPRVAVGQPSNTDYGQDCVDGAYKYGPLCAALVAVGQSCAPTGGETTPRECVAGAACAPNDVCAIANGSNLATGAACVVDQGIECHQASRCIDGVCTALGDSGAACDSLRHCKTGLVCSSANVCTPYSRSGEACGSMQPCTNELFCDVPSGETMGTCAARRPVGGACSGQVHCAANLWCNGSTCAAKVAVGGACNANTEYWACEDALYCTTVSTGMQTGVCANKKGPGASCSGGDCVDTATCTAGTCVRLYCAP